MTVATVVVAARSMMAGEFSSGIMGVADSIIRLRFWVRTSESPFCIVRLVCMV